jgi:hypothetical protein
VDTDEIERLIKANVDKTVTVVDVDGEIQNLFVHSVDEEGFVCDVAAEMTNHRLVLTGSVLQTSAKSVLRETDREKSDSNGNSGKDGWQ